MTLSLRIKSIHPMEMARNKRNVCVKTCSTWTNTLAQRSVRGLCQTSSVVVTQTKSSILHIFIHGRETQTQAQAHTSMTCSSSKILACGAEWCDIRWMSALTYNLPLNRICLRWILQRDHIHIVVRGRTHLYRILGSYCGVGGSRCVVPRFQHNIAHSANTRNQD